MKKVYYQSTVAYFGQIFIWVFLAVVFIVLFLVCGDYSKDNVETIFVCILIAETMASLCVPATMRKIVFSDGCVSVKIGFIWIKKLSYDDIKYINVIRKMSGPHPVSRVFFSKQFLEENQVKTLFDRQSLLNKEDIIFCDYPQKDLKDFLESTFPALLHSENVDLS
ncbi:MAG: hypothetical protein ACI4XE_03755 [Acutalibacteraceae bacterium]